MKAPRLTHNQALSSFATPSTAFADPTPWFSSEPPSLPELLNNSSASVFTHSHRVVCTRHRSPHTLMNLTGLIPLNPLNTLMPLKSPGPQHPHSRQPIHPHYTLSPPTVTFSTQNPPTHRPGLQIDATSTHRPPSQRLIHSFPSMSSLPSLHTPSLPTVSNNYSPLSASAPSHPPSRRSSLQTPTVGHIPPQPLPHPTPLKIPVKPTLPTCPAIPCHHQHPPTCSTKQWPPQPSGLNGFCLLVPLDTLPFKPCYPQPSHPHLPASAPPTHPPTWSTE